VAQGVPLDVPHRGVGRGQAAGLGDSGIDRGQKNWLRIAILGLLFDGGIVKCLNFGGK